MTRKDDLGNENATTSSEITNNSAGGGIARDDTRSTTVPSSDSPGDGLVSDEALNKISGKEDTRPTGQDHSTENREDQMPTSGIGAFEDSSQPLSQTIAHIEDEEK